MIRVIRGRKLLVTMLSVLLWSLVQQFKGFSAQFNKNYGPEESKRFEIFQQNLEVIDRLNREEQGTATYGITQFADLTFDEFIENYTGLRLNDSAWRLHEEKMEADYDDEIVFVDDLNDVRDMSDLEEGLSAGFSDEEGGKDDEEDMVKADGKIYIPRNFDYRLKNAVTPVKYQGACGSCWAFATIANIEGVWAKKTKKLLVLSEQELVDCDKIDNGCDGGMPQNAVMELKRLGGVALSKHYPYRGLKAPCKFRRRMAAVSVKGTKSIPANEKQIAVALVKNGPLSVAVCASESFVNYRGGIFDPSSSQCSKRANDINHGVTIVGYGEENNKAFWIIKNSWGSSWGERGYMKLARNKNACSVASWVSTAIV